MNFKTWLAPARSNWKTKIIGVRLTPTEWNFNESYTIKFNIALIHTSSHKMKSYSHSMLFMKQKVTMNQNQDKIES